MPGIQTKILISACLLGEKVRYNKTDSRVFSNILEVWKKEGRLIPFCPEIAAELPVPRPPAEIIGGDGEAVLKGNARVQNTEGEDVTRAMVRGAELAGLVSQNKNVRIAILKEKSPSCGVHWIYDGSFEGKLKEGKGVAAAYLEKQGIKVFSEKEIQKAWAYLKKLEGLE